jgi:CubicO group peptidase (beta-lactamase class C family)
MTRATLAIVLSALIAAPLEAQSADPRIDSIFGIFNASSPGCAVAVVDGGRTVFAKGYGMASLEHDVPITPSTAFYAASVSKQFTAFAVAMLAQQGKLSLDDDIRKWIPEVPNFGRTITVRHLVHHTSGLRDYFGLLGMTGWPSDGPITEAQFLDLVSRQKALNFAPGERHLYSNTGYVLLSVLVKRVSSKSLREFADEAMFKPLGMNNTQFRDDHRRLVKNRAFAYTLAPAGWQLNVPGFDVVGDGGLYITAEDLAKWARNYDDRTVGANDVTAQVLTRGRLNVGDSIPYAFGIVHNVFRGLATLEHGGAYGGYRTHLMRFPSQRFAVAMLCNSSAANAAGLSQRVASIFLGDRLADVPSNASAAPAPTAVHVPSDRLSRFAAAYWDAKNEVMRRFEKRDSTLVFSGSVLIPVAENRFQNRAGNATFTFVTLPNNAIQLEEIMPTGEKLVYRRMPEAQVDAKTLAGYTANYYSPELDITWRIEPKDKGLVIKRRALPDQTIEPVFLDAFLTPGGVLRFTRDENGRVTGFVVGAGRVTGFRFEVRPDR